MTRATATPTRSPALDPSTACRIRSRYGRTGAGGDIDAELDRADSEPSLASAEIGAGSQTPWASRGADDREGDPGSDDREPDVDAEPSEDDGPALGWNDEEAARGRYPSQIGPQQ
jgi:hypothetical protein